MDEHFRQNSKDRLLSIRSEKSMHNVDFGEAFPVKDVHSAFSTRLHGLAFTLTRTHIGGSNFEYQLLQVVNDVNLDNG